jgi:hypothetical protein
MPLMVDPRAVSSADSARQDRSSHILMPGAGYMRIGPPPEPPVVKRHAFDCEPPANHADKEWHVLKTPDGEDYGPMRWHADTKEWEPVSPFAGNRLAWTSRFLAAWGWSYGKPHGDG